jgi:glutamine synthetase
VRPTLRDACDDRDGSSLARGAFGDEVVDHYANNARVEQNAYERAVTDWELFRSFERM